jgi:hypothetical protein
MKSYSSALNPPSLNWIKFLFHGVIYKTVSRYPERADETPVWHSVQPQTLFSKPPKPPE